MLNITDKVEVVSSSLQVQIGDYQNLIIGIYPLEIEVLQEILKIVVSRQLDIVSDI